MVTVAIGNAQWRKLIVRKVEFDVIGADKKEKPVVDQMLVFRFVASETTDHR